MNKAATISNSDEDFNNDTKIPFIDEHNYNNFKIAKKGLITNVDVWKIQGEIVKYKKKKDYKIKTKVA